MKSKKAQFVADPIVDFWAVIIYVLLAIILIIVYSVLGGCSGDFETSEIRQTESSLSSEYLLLNFLQLPVDVLDNEIISPNMADLIVSAQDNEDHEQFLEERAIAYFGQNYYEWWKLRITYHSGKKIEFQGTEIEITVSPTASNTGGVAEETYTPDAQQGDVVDRSVVEQSNRQEFEESYRQAVIQESAKLQKIASPGISSNAFKKIRNSIEYQNLEDDCISVAYIPSFSQEDIKIELITERYPTYPIFTKFPMQTIE